MGCETSSNGRSRFVRQPAGSGPAAEQCLQELGQLVDHYAFPFNLDIGFGATYVGARVVNTVLSDH